MHGCYISFLYSFPYFFKDECSFQPVEEALHTSTAQICEFNNNFIIPHIAGQNYRKTSKETAIVFQLYIKKRDTIHACIYEKTNMATTFQVHVCMV